MEAEYEEPHPPTFSRCSCAIKGDILANVEKGLKGLSAAPVVKSSPLVDRQDSSLWITAGDEFLAHLRHIAIRQPASWSFRVVSDAELVTAWLATVALKGDDIIDADAHLVSTRYLTIPDLVVPPDLIIIRMGVKVARNVASPEVLAEALNIRYHEDKPTWVWDEPHHPLGMEHLFWSDTVSRILKPWERLRDLSQGAAQKKPSNGGKGGNGKGNGKGRTRPGGRKTLRGGS